MSVAARFDYFMHQYSETEVLKQIHTTVAVGLVLVLNCSSEAGAERSAPVSTKDGAASATSNSDQNSQDENDKLPEVLLTIKGPAKVEPETQKQSAHELVEQTAKEDTSLSSLRGLPSAQNSLRPNSSSQFTPSGAALSQDSPLRTWPAMNPVSSSQSQTSTSPNSLPQSHQFRYTPRRTSLSPGSSGLNPNEKQPIAQRVPNAPGEFGLSSMATALAKQWSVFERISQLDKAFEKFNSTHSTENTIDYLLCKQRVLADLMDLGFDVRRCTNAVDREIAKNASKAAYLTELRDKAIRFNTYADFVAGGLTGIIAGALEMSDLSRFANTSVDISEGVGQAGLSAWAFKAEHAGDRRQGGLPNVLAAVIDPAYRHEAYPDTVRAFLNTPSPDNSSGTSRVDAMLERWERLNFCLTHTGHRMKTAKRVKNLTGTHQEDATATIDLLEDRTAMLHDLRAEVTMMDEAVAELFDLVKRY